MDVRDAPGAASLPVSVSSEIPSRRGFGCTGAAPICGGAGRSPLLDRVRCRGQSNHCRAKPVRESGPSSLEGVSGVVPDLHARTGDVATSRSVVRARPIPTRVGRPGCFRRRTGARPEHSHVGQFGEVTLPPANTQQVHPVCGSPVFFAAAGANSFHASSFSLAFSSLEGTLPPCLSPLMRRSGSSLSRLTRWPWRRAFWARIQRR